MQGGSSGARWLRGTPLTFEACRRATGRRAIAPRVARSEPSRSARSPCIRSLSDAGVKSDAAMDPAAAGSIARRTAPVTPQATTVDEHWDRRRCHARPNSRLIANRTYKEGYRGQDHLWSRCFVEDL